MPSLQTALPPELANNVIRLYRECLRRAKYIGHQFVAQSSKNGGTYDVESGGAIDLVFAFFGCNLEPNSNLVQHNTELLVNMVRQQFKRNKHETDPEKIQKLKDDAARGLINHILYESERLSGRKASKST
ncbi:hypothetical protein POTOM_038275 [Populus tomentosa]|uniref:Complex 1 LYR protein domain-containing protein n=1 Tax=Populus tomentosa TaxID=118781 RepID=A0A8X7YVQ6_POPTO|nr:hypothetical protein POTOM_038275 [Populus tomentosa]